MHLADSANFKGVTSNKLCNSSTGSCFESPNDTIHVTVVPNAKIKTMPRNLSNLLIISILILATISFIIKPDETIIYPISSFLIFATLFVDFYITKLKIKNGSFLRIGKKKSKIWHSVMLLVIGILWVLFPTFFPDSSTQQWKGIDSIIFLGIVYVLASVFRIVNYTILIKERNIAFCEFMNQSEWSISKIDQVLIKNNNVSFYKNDRKKEFIIDDNELPKLKQFLIEKFKEKLIID